MSTLPLNWQAVGPWNNEEVPGCSRLCNACLGVLQQYRSPSPSLPCGFWTTPSSSAERDCVMCIRLLYLRDEKVDFAEIGSLANESRSNSDERVVIYMTLSYSWGGALFPTLRTDNEQQPRAVSSFRCCRKSSKMLYTSRDGLG